MTDHATFERIDAAIQFTSLLVRMVAYGVVGSVASHYSCGQAILTGLFVGDVAASVVATFRQSREHLPQALSELLLLGLVFLWARSELVWPADQAGRAILGLAGFGVFAGRVGLATRIGADDGFA